jgi:hydrogenase maturation factor
MTDFIIIETGHSMMRYDSEVADQTIEFIKNGMFKER